MKKREIIAAGLFLLGFLLVIGTYGKYDFYGFIAADEFLTKTAIGLLLIAASIPVSGDFREEDER